MTDTFAAAASAPLAAVRSDSSAWRLDFRPDIEGLRAIAILLVIAAHAKLPFLEGGYVGVDVFFVLSGYLITGLLAQEVQATCEVRFAAFYARRLRRLLPALLLVIACTGIATAVLLAPFEQANQITAAKAAGLWISNMLFAFADIDYFGPTAESNLFLHTWSLGVEEQFYLIWPALVLFLLGAWGWQGRHKDFDRLRRGMLGVIIVGFCFTLFMTYVQPALAFYLMPSRAWQFAVGAAAFCYSRPGSHLSGVAGRGLGRQLAGWLGLAMILGAGVFLDSRTPYPGAWALLPTLGTALLLSAGAASDGTYRFLSLPPMQWIGKVSYSWYLWHWPVLLLGATLVNIHSPLQVLGLIAVSLSLAVLSFRFVESPIRLNRSLRNHPKASLVAGIALMVLCWLAVDQWNTRIDAWRERPDQIGYLQVRGDLPVIYRLGCDEWFHSAEVKVCAFGSQSASHTAVVMGDSVGLQWFPALARVFDKRGWRLLVITKSSCPMVETPLFYARIGRDYSECTQWRARSLEYIKTLHPDIVVLGSSSSYDLSETQWREGTTRVLAKLNHSASSIYLLASTPILPFEGPACLSRQHWRPDLLSRQCAAALKPDHHADINSWVADAAKAFERVHVIETDALVCPDHQCDAQRDGLVVYRDNQHVTATFARSLAPALGKLIGPLPSVTR